MEQLKSWETKKKIFALFGILSALLTVGNLFIPIFLGDLSSIVETLKIGNNEVFGLYSNGISLVGFAVACIKIVNSLKDEIKAKEEEKNKKKEEVAVKEIDETEYSDKKLNTFFKNLLMFHL